MSVEPGPEFAVTRGLAFLLRCQDGGARLGEITTSRGLIRTPAFMPVGTAATVKAMFTEHVRATGADIILANTYHLMLRPGAERIARLGGLHRFMHWEGPILTDSGGYQVMSLAKLRRIEEEGVTFQSHIDGATVNLTPERAIEMQCLLGADIQMVLDECTPFPASREEARSSMALSLRWAERSAQAFAQGRAPGQSLFGIVQGGVHPDLRQRSAEALIEIGFDGYAIGGLAVGEGQAAMLAMVETTAALLPQDRPRYLMGVGTPDDMLQAIARGIDMFDCVMPTRAGRHALAFTWAGPPQSAQRPLRRRCRAARRGKHLPRRALQPRLSAPSGEVGGDAGRDAAELGQCAFLPGADGPRAGGDRGRGLRKLHRVGAAPVWLVQTGNGRSGQ